jgi:hypothetical protein
MPASALATNIIFEVSGLASLPAAPGWTAVAQLQPALRKGPDRPERRSGSGLGSRLCCPYNVFNFTPPAGLDSECCFPESPQIGLTRDGRILVKTAAAGGRTFVRLKSTGELDSGFIATNALEFLQFELPDGSWLLTGGVNGLGDPPKVAVIRPDGRVEWIESIPYGQSAFGLSSSGRVLWARGDQLFQLRISPPQLGFTLVSQPHAGEIHFRFNGMPEINYSIEASTDLRIWTELTQVSGETTSTVFDSGNTRRFYRAVSR